jgi:hypothetical protein
MIVWRADHSFFAASSFWMSNTENFDSNWRALFIQVSSRV